MAHRPTTRPSPHPSAACPVVDPTFVPRQGVIDALAGTGVRVAVVTAPGGYGKTSHVASWARGEGRPVAWLTLEASDNDPHALLPRLLEELATVTGQKPRTSSARGLMPHQYATVAAAGLRQALTSIDRPFVLVLDDTHVVQSASSIDLLDALVSNIPRGSELVVLGRAQRLHSVIRRSSDPDVREITIGDLALGANEAALVFDRLGVHATCAVVASTVEETEGWPVGIRLAGLQLRDDPNAGLDHLRQAIASQRSIADYVWSQWIPASPDDAEFLMRASVLPTLSASVCDHVLERKDSGQVLHRLEHDRNVIIPLIRHRHGYRLHRLLKDVLADELHRVDPGTARRLHLRASGWFEAAGDDDLAVHHALAARDLARAERLVVTTLPRLFTTGRSLTLQRWLDAFPRAHVQNRPLLCVAAGMACLGSGGGDEAVTWAQFAEHALDRLGDAAEPLERAVFAAFRAMVRCDATSVSLRDAATAVRELPPGTWHAGACLTHGSLSWMEGDFQTADAMLKQAAAEARASDAPSVEAMAHARLALVHLARGELSNARRHAADARDRQRTHLLDEMPTLHVVPAVTALLAVSDGAPELAKAEARLSRRNLSYFDGVAPWVSVPTRLVLSEAALLLGDRATARQLLAEARELLGVAPDATYALSRCDALADRLQGTKGSLAAGRFALTTAELRVLHYLPTNLHLQEIASRLYLSRWTVKSQASSIYRKLGASNRAEAVTRAREAGFLADDESTA